MKVETAVARERRIRNLKGNEARLVFVFLKWVVVKMVKW